MEFIWNYTFWIIFFVTIISFFLYKQITNNPNAITSKYITTLDLDNKYITQDDILQAMKDSKFKNVFFNEENQAFRGIVGFSMSSFFEHVEVRLIENEGKQTLNFFSICGLPTQIFDWGKNKRNYKRFLKNLYKKSNS